MTELAAGQIIVERYELQRLLGEGGMGSVWAARHVITKKHVALKFLRATGEKVSETLVRRFLREARAVSAVNHPNVVSVHDVLRLEDGSPVMVLDLLNGDTLGDRLMRARVMDLRDLARILVPVISAVGTAHAAGIVHRDLKPDNIMIHNRGDGSVEPKVLDFGIAKLSATEGEAAATAHLTQTGAVMGTPYYMSPEQVYGEKDIDQQADVWAMGCILYECLSGRKPITGENFGQLFKAITTGDIVPLPQIAAHLPVDVTQLIERMLKPNRRERCQDLREAYTVLSRYSDEKALSFGDAAVPSQRSVTDLSNPTAAYASPGVTGQPIGGTNDGLAHTAPASESIHIAKRPLWPALALGVVALLGAAGGLWFFFMPDPSRTAEIDEPSSAASTVIEPLVEEATARPDAGEVEVSPADAATPEPSESPPPSPTRAPQATKAPAPKPAATTKPEPKPEPPPPKEEKLPGSVVSDVPF